MGDLWLSVLGPLGVTVDQREVELRSDMQTRLLAVLVCGANRSMASRTLIEALWDDPPASAAENLRKYIAMLRKAIGCERVVRDRAGYRLVLQDSECDARVFQGLVDKADEAFGEDRTLDAERSLIEALDLWKGPAYAGFTDIGLIRPTVERLEEARAAVVERRVEASLALGRHETLIPELASFVAEFPLRERLRRQWMLALYRSGREADALDVYRQWSKLLDEELGLRPGQEIKDLELAILNQDGGLDWTSSARRHRTPAELPFDVASTFTGRAPAVARLRRLLTQESSAPVVVSAIFGTGGIGKSALAIHVGHQIADLFPDGQLYVNLHGSTPDVEPLTPVEALARLLRSLGLAENLLPDNLEELGARFRSVTSGKRLLILLDNALDEDQVRPLLPASPTTRVLITSRRPLADLDDARHERLDVLPHDEAHALLKRLIGPDRLEVEAEALEEVVAYCCGFPLALCIAASRLRTRPAWSVKELARRLRMETDRLSEMETRNRGVRASFAVSYVALDTDVRRCFRLISLLDIGEISVPLAAAAADLPSSRAEEMLDQLVDAQLIENHVEGRYRMHDLLRLFARERAEAEDSEHERSSAVERSIHFLIATARTASRLIQPSPRTERLATYYPQELTSSGLQLHGRRAALAWVDAEASVILQVVNQAAKIRGTGPSLAIGLAAGAMAPFWYRGRFVSLLRLGRLAIASADVTDEPRHRGLGYCILGVAQVNYQQLSQGIDTLVKAIAEYQKTGDQADEAYQLGMLGVALSRLGRHEDAIWRLQRAIRMAQACRDRPCELFIHNEYGAALKRHGRPKEALDAHRTALGLCTEVGFSESFTLAAIADLYRALGRFDEAIETFERSLANAEEFGDGAIFTSAVTSWKLGQACFENGLAERARGCWRRSADILFGLGLIGIEEKEDIYKADHPGPLELLEHHLPDLMS